MPWRISEQANADPSNSRKLTLPFHANLRYGDEARGRNHADKAQDCGCSRRICVGDYPGICCGDAERRQQEFQHAGRRAFLLYQRGSSGTRQGRKPSHLYQRGRGRRPGCRAGFRGRYRTGAARQTRLRPQVYEARFRQIQGAWRVDALREIDLVEDHQNRGAAQYGKKHGGREPVGDCNEGREQKHDNRRSHQ